jgi:hypothetical protein
MPRNVLPELLAQPNSDFDNLIRRQAKVMGGKIKLISFRSALKALEGVLLW